MVVENYINLQDICGFTNLMYASSYGHYKFVSQLLEIPGINVNLQNNDGNSSLMLACRDGHYKVVSQLLEIPGINVNLQNNYGFTSLMYASYFNNVDIFKLLLTVPGINIDMNNMYLQTIFGEMKKEKEIIIKSIEIIEPLFPFNGFKGILLDYLCHKIPKNNKLLKKNEY